MRKKFTMLLASLFLVMGTAWAQTAATYADGLYKIYWQSDNRGYLTYHEEDYPNEPQLSGVTLSGCENKHYASDAEGIKVAWYLYTSTKSGKSYLFEATTGKFIAINPNEVAANGRTCVLTTEVTSDAQMNLLATDGDYAGSYMFRYVIGSTNYHFCSGCGSNKDQHPVRFSTDGQNDGGNRFVFVEDANLTITDEIKNAAIAKIEEFESIVGSTAENKIFYHIKNVRSGKYANYEGAGAQFTQVATPTLGSYWYLMEVADAENVPSGYKAYRLYNAANALAVENPSNGNMSENVGVQWPAKVYCIGAHTNGGYTGVVLRPLKEDASSWNDAGGKGEKIGTYSYDDPGSIWAFERANITEAQLIQNAVAAKTAVVNTLTTEATNTQRYFYGYELSTIEAKKAEVEAISVPENSLAEAMTGAIKISKNTLLAGLERIAPKAGDKFIMDNKERDGRLTAFEAETDVKCLAESSPFAYFDAVWTLVATETEGQFKLYNEKLKVYVGVLANANNTTFKYVSAAEDAGVYKLDNVNGYATFKRVDGGDTDYLHQSNWGGKEIVRWDNGDASQWQLAKAFGPDLTTDAENPICYALKSGRDGNYYFTLDNNKVKLFNNKSIATEETTHWYFMLDESGNLKMYSKSGNKAMGYLTGTDGNTKLTNDENTEGYDNSTYTLYFAPYNQTNYNDAWFALKPSRGDTYVSNHGGTSNYMGFYNEFNDAGTRIAFVNVDRMRLEAKVAECEAKVVGDGLGYYSVSGGDAATALADAKAALQGNSNVAYRNSLAALNALTYTLNMPKTGKFYRLQNHQSGWYATSDIRTGQDQHSNKLWMANENNTARTIWYLTDDNKFLSYTMGQYLGDMSSDWSFETVGAEGNVVEFKESQVAGKYQILPSSGRALYGDQVRVDAAGDGNNSGNYAWSIQEVTWLPVAMNAEIGYATLYSPVQLELSQGRVKAYTGTVNGDWLTLNEQTAVPANQGVVLVLQEGATVENGYTYLQVQESDVEVKENAFRGTHATQKANNLPDEGTIYTLQKNKNGEGVVFGIYEKENKNEDGTVTVTVPNLNGFRAYLPISTSTPAQSISIRFEGTTDIEHSTLNPQPSTQIYDLLGRRVEAITKGGIYIVNGKKVVVK